MNRTATSGIDRQLVGRRIKEARLRAGFTQAQLAGEQASAAYISRIESGQRMPSRRLLTAIAHRLGLEPADLTAPAETEFFVGLRLGLGRAEQCLAEGDPLQAATESMLVEQQARNYNQVDVTHDACLLRAAAAMELGEPGSAAQILERLIDGEPGASVSVRAHAKLCASLLATGELQRAAEIAARGARLVSKFGLAGLPEALELDLAHARALAARGNLTAAARVSHRGVNEAARLVNTHGLVASAYWNASETEAEFGIDHFALLHAQRASAALELDLFRHHIDELTGLLQSVRSALLRSGPASRHDAPPGQT